MTTTDMIFATIFRLEREIENQRRLFIESSRKNDSDLLAVYRQKNAYVYSGDVMKLINWPKFEFIGACIVPYQHPPQDYIPGYTKYRNEHGVTNYDE